MATELPGGGFRSTRGRSSPGSGGSGSDTTTKTALTASAGQLSPRQTVTLTATVTGVQLSNGVPTCTYTPQNAQTDILSADYVGSAEYAESGAGVDLPVT